jgi:biopolymer transport protein ExbB
MFSLLMKGGIVIVPILLLSVVTVYLFIQKFMSIRNQAKIDQTFIDQVVYELRNNNLDRAQMIASNNPHAIGRIVKSGVNQVGKPMNVVEGMMESSINLEIAIMEKTRVTWG